jgi:hypothetical protein
VIAMLRPGKLPSGNEVRGLVRRRSHNSRSSALAGIRSGAAEDRRSTTCSLDRVSSPAADAARTRAAQIRYVDSVELCPAN